MKPQRVVTRNQQIWNTFYEGLGRGWLWGGFGEATTATETYKVGTLVVDLFDTRTKKLVWRGTSSDRISNNSNKSIESLDRAWRKCLSNSLQAFSK